MGKLPKNTLIYVDETGIDTFLYREYGRAPRGVPIVEKVSGKKFLRTNIVAGYCNGNWVAPLQYHGTTDSKLFEYWFSNCLPREIPKGSTIILDNATFHKKSVLPALAAAAGCYVLFLPPYSPNLNPIEKKWAWLKRKLREILHNFTTFDDAISSAFQS